MTSPRASRHGRHEPVGNLDDREWGMTVDINGMAHVILTVSQFDAARAFYRRLLPEFGMKIVSDSDKFFRYYLANGIKIA